MQKTLFKPLVTFICVSAICFCFASQAAAEPGDNNVIYCKGHGTISFQGDGKILINGDGILVVKENTVVDFPAPPGDEESEADGNEPECIQTEDGSCIYIGIEDTATGEPDLVGGNIENRAEITGENLEVSFTGANISVKASGNAKLMLKGYGIYIYRTDTVTGGRWTFGGKTILLED